MAPNLRLFIGLENGMAWVNLGSRASQVSNTDKQNGVGVAMIMLSWEMKTRAIPQFSEESLTVLGMFRGSGEVQIANQTIFDFWPQ